MGRPKGSKNKMRNTKILRAAKKIGDTERILVGTGQDKKGKPVFFVGHKAITKQMIPIVAKDFNGFMLKMHRLVMHSKKYDTSLRLKTYSEIMDL